MKKILLWMLVLPTALYGCVLIGFLIMQDYLMFRPDTNYHAPADQKNDMFQEVVLTTLKGNKIDAWYAEGHNNLPAILYLHGNSGNIARYAEKMIPYINAGYTVLMVEYEGYGKTKGKPSEKNMTDDALAGFKFLQAKNHRIILHGHSMGTAVALALTEIVTPVGVILEAPFFSIKAMMKEDYPFLPRGLLFRNRFNSNRRLRKLTVPFLIVHGDQDETVPLSQSEDLFENAQVENKILYVIPGGKHNDLADKGLFPILFDWIQSRFSLPVK